MKVLVVGSGGREHALCWRLHQSESVWGLFCTGANPGISQLAKPVNLAPTDSAGLARFAADNAIDLTIVGPENPLAAGIVDEFDRQGLCVFGPIASCGATRIEQGLRQNGDARGGHSDRRLRGFRRRRSGPPLRPGAESSDGGQGRRPGARQRRHGLRRRGYRAGRDRRGDGRAALWVRRRAARDRRKTDRRRAFLFRPGRRRRCSLARFRAGP